MSRPLKEYSVADLEPLANLSFIGFTTDDAVDLGLVAVQVIKEWDLSLAVDIVLHGDLVFRAKLGATDAQNNPWLEGKAAVAVEFGEPSMLVKARHREAGTSFTDRDLDHELMKAHGGSLPLRVDGHVVGTITMSGEPDATDHEAVVEALQRYLASRTNV